MALHLKMDQSILRKREHGKSQMSFGSLGHVTAYTDFTCIGQMCTNHFACTLLFEGCCLIGSVELQLVNTRHEMIVIRMT